MNAMELYCIDVTLSKKLSFLEHVDVDMLNPFPVLDQTYPYLTWHYLTVSYIRRLFEVPPTDGKKQYKARKEATDKKQDTQVRSRIKQEANQKHKKSVVQPKRDRGRRSRGRVFAPLSVMSPVHHAPGGPWCLGGAVDHDSADGRVLVLFR